MVQHLLHGTLYATIFEVDKIHTGCGFNLGCKGAARDTKRRLLSQVQRLLLCRPETVGSKLYATIDLDKARVGRTRMIENQRSNPQWGESFRIYCAHRVSNIIFTIKDDNPLGATLIGRAYLPVEEILNGHYVDRWIDILDDDHNPIHGHSKIHVRLHFQHVTSDTSWSQGVSSTFRGVPYAFFLQREGCRVSLYRDAHDCWTDIFGAIVNAQRIIYITGWSVYTKITLIRGEAHRPTPDWDLTLGELLKKKADDGVRVLMLIWDDRTSVDVLKRDGLMATHDQETADYFRGTNVHCVLCPRNPDDGRSLVQGFEVSTMFTHHQKTVIVDSSAAMDGEESEKRRIVSFVGGIDLCDGRYDTPNHPLFRTLNTVHRDDFHQPNFSGASITKGGPREPWHDIHCQLEGPVAWDVLYNFEQRWRKQVRSGLLFSRNRLDQLIVSPAPVTLGEDQHTWNVQIFRSIDGGAAAGFPENPEEAAKVGLITGKDNVIDRSIQDAYISAIRRAKNFVYIENQYFVGSSYDWRSDDIKVEDIGALHLIPKELSLKIVSKIEAQERFTVYVVIPMWPEGIPESSSVQAILDWQRRTMEMMYTDVASALQAKGLSADLRDYLTFFCLGNREVKRPGEYVPPETPEPDSDYSRAQQSRRFMIYVHAKMMIVDDEYIIVGSANINQRSMDGARDSEIAMGGYQPYHLAADQSPSGEIYVFRMSLWHEHLGELHQSFTNPESLHSVRRVNQAADFNWGQYSSNSFNEDLHGHLLSYPIAISSTGRVTPLPGVEFFPDTKARVLGTRGSLPPILTT